MKETTRKKITAALLALFTLMLLAGVLLGEPAVVFKKAIDLCLECIGIGG